MKRIVFPLVLCLVCVIDSFSQSLSWAKQFTGDTHLDIARVITVDNNGYIYVAGTFLGTMDGDPGPGISLLNAAGDTDIFILKLDPSGNLIWARKIGGTSLDEVNAIKVDAVGNIILGGYFEGSSDLDPGPGTLYFTVPYDFFAYHDGFILKLDNDGNFLWAAQIGSSKDETVNDIDLDAEGNIYATGTFNGTVDFDPGIQNFNITPTIRDAFVWKLNSDGSFGWAKNFRSLTSGLEEGGGIAVSVTGAVYTTGVFSSSLDLDPGPETAILSSINQNDIYVSKLSATGEFINAFQLGSGGKDYAGRLEIDLSDNLIVTGGFGPSGRTMDFDPGTDTFNLTALGEQDAFIAKYNGEGQFLWAGKFGATGTSIRQIIADITTDNNGNVYTTGNFHKIVDFDPGPGVFNLNPNEGGSVASNINAFLSGLDGSGKFLWAKKIGSGSNMSSGFSLEMDSKNNWYAGGYFTKTSDMDPGPGIHNLTSPDYGDAYVIKLSASNVISGDAFIDINGDGIKQSDEKNYKYRKIRAKRDTLSWFTNSDSNGRFNFHVDTGAYEISIETLPFYFTSNPFQHHAVFNGVFGTSDTANQFAVKPIGEVNDLTVTLTHMSANRPGFDVMYRLTYKNIGNTRMSGVVTMEHDALLSLIKTIPSANSYSNRLLLWEFSDLDPSDERHIDLTFNLDPTTSLLEILNNKAFVVPVSGDNSPENNSMTLLANVTGSYDPNDKQVSPKGNISPDFVINREKFDYTIRFQNTGTDTAFTVIIRDTISSLLDYSSLETISASHSFNFKISEKGAAEWRFDNILLVDSNRNEPASHGFVRYYIKPKNSVAIGSEIKNTAHIYFDFNSPVITNETVNRVTILTSIGQNPEELGTKIFPNPASTSINIQYQGKFYYRLVDFKGREIFKSSDAFNTTQLNISSLAKGIYLIEITTPKGMRTHKFIVH